MNNQPSEDTLLGSGIPLPRAQRYYTHRDASSVEMLPEATLSSANVRSPLDNAVSQATAAHDAFLIKLGSRVSRIARDGSIVPIVNGKKNMPLTVAPSKRLAPRASSASMRRWKSSPSISHSLKPRVKYKRLSSRGKSRQGDNRGKKQQQSETSAVKSADVDVNMIESQWSLSQPTESHVLTSSEENRNVLKQDASVMNPTENIASTQLPHMPSTTTLTSPEITHDISEIQATSNTEETESLKSAALRVLRKYPNWSFQAMKEMTEAVQSTVWKMNVEAASERDVQKETSPSQDGSKDSDNDHADSTSKSSVSLNPDDYDLPNLESIPVLRLPSIPNTPQPLVQQREAPSYVYGKQAANQPERSHNQQSVVPSNPRPSAFSFSFVPPHAQPKHPAHQQPQSRSSSQSSYGGNPSARALQHSSLRVRNAPENKQYNSSPALSTSRPSASHLPKYRSQPTLNDYRLRETAGLWPGCRKPDHHEPSSAPRYPYVLAGQDPTVYTCGTTGTFGIRMNMQSPYAYTPSPHQPIMQPPNTYAEYGSMPLLPPLPAARQSASTSFTPIPAGAMSPSLGSHMGARSHAIPSTETVSLPPIHDPPQGLQITKTNVARAAEDHEPSTRSSSVSLYQRTPRQTTKIVQPVKLGGLGPDIGSEEYKAKLEKWQRQKEYGAQIRAITRTTPHNVSDSRSQPDLRPHSQTSTAARAHSARSDSGDKRMSPSPSPQQRQSVAEKGRKKQPASVFIGSKLASSDKLEQAIAKREKMKAYASTIKKPTLCLSSSSPVRTSRESAKDLTAAVMAEQDELRQLEEEHERGLEAVENIRKELGL
ncbi:uncharacterized protein SPPG_01378 [Spizellomyces punctatus DAOM BR117]|uniref:Uncharacterized protein n=1 Tax=Spizellomyces punctatus (strain DAOM BR117) TaxID=645134 RepID=A0A0L0HSS4_SPIPD|nr:uncharacterized protein SPPG_01378 [Spizellomyces punctatus DAOM BR117]KND03929.1 hypothetical protein SPPG_01378 [Spizellomyces punctatus DAOM BR117]|eukprot:XP_016611968.1 hypothetical protein SPPG_01378 [Spizellomyces punctatus DAOM BR117]